VKERRGRRRKQLLGDLKKMRIYWKLKAAALDRTLRRTRFGRGYGPVVRQYGMNIGESGWRCTQQITSSYNVSIIFSDFEENLNVHGNFY
jgi:hypothetical protein